MRRTPRPTRRESIRSRPPHRRGVVLYAAALLLAALPLAGCVEISRTEKGRYGNPLESYSSGPRTTFEADNYRPPTAIKKPWYERMFDW